MHLETDTMAFGATEPTDREERVQKKTVILSTAASAYFAELIHKQLPGSTFTQTVRKVFPGGERYFRIDINDQMDLVGANVILVASICNDDELAEVTRVGTAAAMYGARRVIYVIPFEGYTTMDRAKIAGEIVTAKTIARELSNIPRGDTRNAFLFLDLHTEGFVHYFEDNCLRIELSGDKVIEDAISHDDINPEVIGSVDLGRPKRIVHRAQRFNADLAFISKKRNFEKTEITNVIGDVKLKKMSVSDDMCRSAGTLLDGAEAYLKLGAYEVSADVTHLALTGEEVIDLLLNSDLKRIITTNSHPMSQHPRVLWYPGKFVVNDVSHLFVEVIKKLL